MKRYVIVLMLSLGCIAAMGQYNDHIILKSGEIIECKIAQVKPKTILYFERVGDIELNSIIKTRFVDKIIFGEIDKKGVFQIQSIKFSPGDELIKAKGFLFAGLGLSIAGSLIIVSGATLESPEEILTFTYIGVSLGVIGWFFHFIGYSHIGNAGILLNRQYKSNNLSIQGTNYGIGLVYNF